LGQEESIPTAQQFRDALIEQRAAGVEGGLYNLLQVLFSYNSNRIEGSELTEEQTRAVYESPGALDSARLDDVLEATGHFLMFDLMLDSINQELSLDLILQYHRLLKEGTSDSQQDWFAVGGWKQMPNVVGQRATTPPQLVDGAMEALLADFAGRQLSFYDITDFHHRFEAIHPFQDGNGRVGRIVLFGHCLANSIMPFIVPDRQKSYYYGGLTNYRKDPTLLRQTFRSFQDEFAQTYRPFLPALSGAQ